MEEKLSNHQSRQHIASIPLNHNSRSISKLKPNIRVVHLIAPEIIQTDVTNFRNLVQQLTGKPTANRKKLNNISVNANPSEAVHRETCEKIEKEETVVKCEDQWIIEGTNSSNYLSYLDDGEGDVDGFFQPTFDLSSFLNVSS